MNDTDSVRSIGRVLDIKPFVREFQPRTEVRQPSWISELMVDDW